jgi:hypothetical protein
MRKRQSKAFSTPEWPETLTAIQRLKKGHAVAVEFSTSTLKIVSRFQFRRILRQHLADPQLKFSLLDGVMYVT